MDSYRRSGVMTGILFLAADAAGFLSFIAQPFLGGPDLLVRISANEMTVIAGALLVMVMGWADAGIGISMFGMLRRHNEGLALGAAGFRIIDGMFHCVAAVLMLFLVTVSGLFVVAAPGDAAGLQSLGNVLAAGRSWVSNVAALPAWCIGAFLYYFVFFRTGLVARWLSVWGLAGITLTMAGCMLVLFGVIVPYSTVQLLMYLPAATQEIVLAVWLIVKGYNRPAGERHDVPNTH